MTAKSFANRRFFIFSFVVFAIASVAVAKFSFTSQAEAPQAAMLAPTITATNVDAITTDVDGDGRADPGDTLEYTVTINNTAAPGAGNDATGVQFNETLHANTTLVGGSVVASPIAVNDSFSSIGNVGISVPAASSVFANDINPGGGTLTVQSVNQAGLQGTLSLNTTTGAFDFTPNAGFEGSTTFTYTLANGSGFTSTATVTINVSGMIWFINANAGVNGDGRLGAPFNSLANFNAGAADDPTDSIFLFESANPYTGGITLLSGQKLIGQDATATLAAIAGVTVPSFSNPALPVMNSANGTVTNLTSTMTLVANTTLRGFSVNTATSTGISGGAVSGVTTSELRVSTTTGTAVSLTGTGGTFSFISISANGGANGIFLQNTTGSFTVVGDGTNTSVGGNSSGGTISNATGADGATAGSAIYMSNVQNVTLRRMTINGTNQNFGVRGLTVSGFTMEYSTVTGTNGTNQAFDDSAVYFTELTGSAAITSCNITNGYEFLVYVVNTSGTLNRLTIDSTTINGNNSANGDDALHLEAFNGAVFRATVTNSTFTSARGDIVNVNGANTSNVDLVFRGNKVSNNHPAILSGGGGLTISSGGAGSNPTFTYDISCNTFRDAKGNALTLFRGTGSGTMSGTVFNNLFGVAGVLLSGSSQATNIHLDALGSSTHTALIKNNILREYNETAILASLNSGNSTMNLTIIGNTTDAPPSGGAGVFTFSGLFVDVGVLPGDSNTLNLKFGGAGAEANNFVDGDPFNANDIYLSRLAAAGTTFNYSRVTSGSNDPTAITLANNTNPLTITVSGTITPVNTVPALPAAISEACSPPPFAPEFEGETKAADSFDNNVSLLHTSYQTPLEVLTSIQPLSRPSCNAETFSNAEVVKAEAAIVEIQETNGASYSKRVAAFFSDSSRLIGDAVGKLDSLITPTVTAEEASNISYAPFSGETISVGGGGFTLPAGKSITIKFRATVDNTPVGLTQVSTQGTVSGSNFSNVLTDDTAVGGGADPTATLIDSTTVTVSSSQNPSITGQSVTFTATLTGAPVHGAGNPGGTVQFFDNGVAVGAPVAVVAGAVNTSTAQFVTSSLTAGSHPITATYSGGAGFNANNTSNTVNQSVSNTAVWDGSTSSAWADGTNWTTNGAPSLATNDVSIPAAGVTNNPTISAANVTVNNLTLSAGRTLTINTNRTLNINGLLTMNGNNLDASSGLVAFGPGGTATRTSGSILGNVDKSFTATGAFNYPVGTATGHSPVSVNITALATNPSTLRVLANDGTAPAVPVLVDATTLNRYWTLTETGDLTASVVFNYLQPDVRGTETNYVTIRVTGTSAVGLPNGTPCPGAGSPCVDAGANTITVNGLQAFSNWTAGELAPVAANVSVSGRVIDTAGNGVFNTLLRLTDNEGNIRFARTNPFGYYRFLDVAVGENYILTAENKRFAFDSRLVVVDDNLEDLIIIANPR